MLLHKIYLIVSKEAILFPSSSVVFNQDIFCLFSVCCVGLNYKVNMRVYVRDVRKCMHWTLCGETLSCEFFVQGSKSSKVTSTCSLVTLVW